jgi:hypothetical protein
MDRLSLKLMSLISRLRSGWNPCKPRWKLTLYTLYVENFLLNALWSQGLKDGYISMEIFLYVWK